MKRIANVRRVRRLIDESIDALGLDLSGLRVLTEVASGAYVVTPLLAARAGATRVDAVSRDSRHGLAADVIAYGREWAAALGVADRVHCSGESPSALAQGCDIATSLGFVRPIDAAVIGRLPRHAVVALMCEPWEARSADVDLAACERAGIAVVGTRETDPRVRTFEFVGLLAVKLLLECEVEVCRSRVVVVGSDPFGGAVADRLEALGASVTRVQPEGETSDLDRLAGALVADADAMVLAEHRYRGELVGVAGGVRPYRFAESGCQLVHLAGSVDTAALAVAGVSKSPDRMTTPGYMTLSTDYVGPRPVIDLHAAGLHAAAAAVRHRLSGGTVDEAIAAAELTGVGLRAHALQSS